MSAPKATLATKFLEIECLNPFWLASAPPANCGEQVMRAFDAGLGRRGVEDDRGADYEREFALLVD